MPIQISVQTPQRPALFQMLVFYLSQSGTMDHYFTIVREDDRYGGFHVNVPNQQIPFLSMTGKRLLWLVTKQCLKHSYARSLWDGFCDLHPGIVMRSLDTAIETGQIPGQKICLSPQSAERAGIVMPAFARRDQLQMELPPE